MKLVAAAVACVACASILCPYAGALDRSRLALMPLPRQALGADAVGLPLGNDSGVDSNSDAARNAGPGVTAADLASYGRITGYTLDYVRPVSALLVPHGLLEVKTIAELYRSNSMAARGLVFWRGVTKKLGSSTSSGVTIRLTPFDERLKSDAFAFELRYQRAGQTLGFVGDIVFRTGNLLGAVFVTSSTEKGLRARTLNLASRLSLRIEQVLAGKLTGPPVDLSGAK